MIKPDIKKLPEASQFREFLFPGIVIILIVITAVTVLKPKIDSLLEIRQGVAKQKKELGQLSQKSAVLEGYDQNELKNRTEKLLKVLPVEKDGPLIVATMRSLVSENNLELISLGVNVGELATESAEPTKKEETVPSLKIALDVAGELGDLYNFLSAVESITPIMRVDKVGISREGTSVESQVSLSNYFLAMPKEIGKVSRQIVPVNTEEEKVYQEVSNYQPPAMGTALPIVTSGKENPFAY